jgi:hypothetical protein
MKKVVIDFIVTQKIGSDKTSLGFDGDCAIKEQTTTSRCTKRLVFEDHINIEKMVNLYLTNFRLNHKCDIKEYQMSVVDFPIYNPKTFVDNAINEEWDKLNVTNIKLILDAYYSKFEDECRQCDIQPINNLFVYAEQMLNQILTDDDQREVFYKFVVG